MNGEISKGRMRTGLALSWFIALFFVMDGVMKVVRADVAVATTVQLGYAEPLVPTIGVLMLACTALYLIPATTLWGALLLTAYLGGAVATNVRAATPAFNMIFPVLCAGFVWGGLALRRADIAELLRNG